jgi:hypothetical protein
MSLNAPYGQIALSMATKIHLGGILRQSAVFGRIKVIGSPVEQQVTQNLPFYATKTFTDGVTKVLSPTFNLMFKYMRHPPSIPPEGFLKAQPLSILIFLRLDKMKCEQLESKILINSFLPNFYAHGDPTILFFKRLIK